MWTSPDQDWAIRLAAFAALERLTRQHGPVLPWEVIDQGFTFAGNKVFFANRARGIFKPKQMSAALSLKTTVPRRGRVARYDDIASGTGSFLYRYQGTDPNSWDNIALSQAAASAAPLIYFYGIDAARYEPLWPVYVARLDPAALTCEVVVDDAPLVQGIADPAGQMIRRAYVTVQAKRRLHQDTFRVRVLDAYRNRCCICGLPTPKLLEAAHIRPDCDEQGVPEVPNGLSLCRLHHRAFDADLLGIRPDSTVEIGPALMGAKDGPTLEHALKGFDGKQIAPPSRSGDRPRVEYLEHRYEQFRQAVG